MTHVKQGWSWNAGDCCHERLRAYEELHAWLRNRLLLGPVTLTALAEVDLDHAERRGIAVAIEVAESAQ